LPYTMDGGFVPNSILPLEQRLNYFSMINNYLVQTLYAN
jgi:hypothetical protein